jgi:beta-galactosidase/beta-glucuronidase
VVPLSANRRGHTVTVTVTDAAGEVATATARADLDLAPALRAVVPADRLRTWGPGDPHLYGVDIELDVTRVREVQAQVAAVEAAENAGAAASPTS